MNINLKLTVTMLKNVFKLVKFLINFKGSIWFVNMDQNSERYLEHSAKKCGEFFSSTNWVRGFLTNINILLIHLI